MRNSNKNTVYVEDNNTNIYAKFQLRIIPLMTSEKKIFEYFFRKNITFWLPWQPIKIDDLEKIHMVCRGLLQEHFCKTFV